MVMVLMISVLIVMLVTDGTMVLFEGFVWVRNEAKILPNIPFVLEI